MYEQEDRLKAYFEWNRFYKELAIGTGFGARFDFSFLILRIDLGLTVKDPLLPVGERFIFLSSNYEESLAQLQFGIGYPF